MVRVTRRHLLLGAAVVPLAGCAKAIFAPTPIVSVSDAPPTLASPTGGLAPAIPELGDTWTAEAGMVAWLDALLAAPASWKANDSMLTWLRGHAATHRAHVAWLESQQAIGTVAPPPPGVTTIKALQAEFIRREKALSDAHRAAASSAPGWWGALFGSLASYAQAATTLGPAGATVRASPAPFDPAPAAEAWAILLGYVDTLVYAYQTGMGRLPHGDKNWTPASKRLVEVERLRDQVAASIRSLQQSPPPVRLSYTLPGRLGNPVQIRAMWGAAERGVLDAFGGVVASLDGKDRLAAITMMVNQAVRPAAWGQPVTWWPGWQE